MSHITTVPEKFPRTDCSTIIVGKNASSTGHVLMGHNEDDMGCYVQSHLVSHAAHQPGETVTFADAPAVIPQIPETLGFYWSEFRDPAGEAFADAFVNECGVSVVSNGCVASKVPENTPNYGIGYGLRHLIAARAHTAREGVEIAAALIEEYGYYSARSYAICDKDEGWIFQVTTGHNFVAQRVGDDEVQYIPNWYTIRGVDFSDEAHDRFYWSKNLVSYAIENGWYTPAADDYSDFDFALVYQDGAVEIPSNMLRSDLAWKQLTGAEPVPYRTFSIKAPKTYSVADLKAILRSHYEGHDEDLKADPKMSPHRYGICRDTTVESMVVEFADEAALTCVWRAFPRPCIAPYTPWYVGITRLPRGYEVLGARTAFASHFSVDPAEMRYDPSKAYHAFHLLENIMEFDYQACEATVHGDISKMEALSAAVKPQIDAAYRALIAADPEAAASLLTDYTASQAEKAWEWAVDTAQTLVDAKNAANMDFWRSKL